MTTHEIRPQTFPLPCIGTESTGNLIIATMDNTIPFVAKRIFWTCDTPSNVERGGHAHRNTHQVLVSVAGRIEVFTEMRDGSKAHFVLDDPRTALYLPAMCWRVIHFADKAVLLAMASTPFDHADYIRDLEEFRTSEL